MTETDNGPITYMANEDVRLYGHMFPSMMDDVRTLFDDLFGAPGQEIRGETAQAGNR